MSNGFSDSESSSNQRSTQFTTTGGSGANSPTVSAEGDVTIQNAGGEVSLAALQGMVDVVQGALSEVGSIAGRNVDASTQQAINDTSLLSTILKSNSDLAANVQSGGAASAQKTTNYVVFGLIGIALLAVGIFLFRKS